MRYKKVLGITATVLGIVVAILGGCVYWQYRTARPPALDSMPIYSARVAVPITDAPEPQRTDTETQFRDLASTVQPGYRVADERFLATKGPFTWDAVRHHVGSRLGTAYTLDRNGSSSDDTIVYSIYKHPGWLRAQFNDDVILAVGLVKTTMKTATGDDVYLYGYFRLTHA
jgi:hypothetical protein